MVSLREAPAICNTVAQAFGVILLNYLSVHDLGTQGHLIHWSGFYQNYHDVRITNFGKMNPGR